MPSTSPWPMTEANRYAIADMLAGLSPAQWASPSLCGGWTVRMVAGHLLMPLVVSPATLVVDVAKARGSLDRAFDRVSRRLAERPTDEIVTTMRAKAQSRTAPPVVGAGGPLADSCIHMRDMARPLGLDVTAPLDSWRRTLEVLVSPAAMVAFVPRGRLRGLRLEATDQEWAAGPVDGAPVRGTSEALALAATGRRVVLGELEGDGVATLAARC